MTTSKILVLFTLAQLPLHSQPSSLTLQMEGTRAHAGIQAKAVHF